MIRPFQVGITGGIGSGKSLVSRIFKTFGIPVYDADTHARELMTTDEILVGQITKEFGTGSYNNDGSLDRSYLSSATFGKKDRLEKLNNIVHPRVAVDYLKWSEEHTNFPYVLREAALLYEIGANTNVDKMIVVTAPEDVRISRIISRDPHRTIEQIKAIIKSQWPEEEKVKRADYIVVNDDGSMILPQILNIHGDILLKLTSNN